MKFRHLHGMCEAGNKKAWFQELMDNVQTG